LDISCPAERFVRQENGRQKDLRQFLFSINAGFRRFSPVIPLSPRLFAETKKGDFRKFLPALFVFGACFFARATKKRV
jgi:hypothetical protein